jgi:L-2,4-diaminobutyrate transaminase
MTERKNITPYDDLAASDRQHLLHPQTNMVEVLTKGPKIIEGGQGIRVKDAKGNTLIDAMAGLWCVNVGYGRKELAETMADAAKRLSYFHSFTAMSNPPEIRLAEKLTAMAPGKLARAFFGCSGSDANDTLVKIVWHYNYIRGKPGKKKIISRKWSYHGTSVSTASLTGLASFHAPYNLPIPEVKHTEMPHFYRFGQKGESEAAFVERTVKALEDLIAAEGPETVGAFIAEPVTGAGGVVAPPNGYFEAVQKILKRHDILMIADEVITGFGRLGAMFGSELYGITPDLMASAKGLTSGYFPLSAALISPGVAEVLLQGSEKTGNFAHGYTYSGHPVGCEVALRNLQIIEDEKLVENAANVGAYLHRRLNEAFANHAFVGEVRGQGLIAGIQLILDKDKKIFFGPKRKIPVRIAEACYARGLIVRPLPTVTTIALSPPLVITKAEVDEVVEILVKAVDEVTGTLSREDKIPAA